MSNTIRATWSNPVIVLLIGDPKRILRHQDLSILPVYNYENPGRVGCIEQKPIHNFDQAFSLLDHEGPPPSPTSLAQSASAAVIPHVESSPQVWEYMRQIVAEEVCIEDAKLSQQVTQQAVENVLSDIFLTGYTKAGRRLKNAS